MNKNNLKIILIIIIIDFIFSQLFLLDFLNKKKEQAYKDIAENRISNSEYGYGFKKNATFNSVYQDIVYEINTNNLGFRDFSNRNLNKNKNYSIIIGDSFVEGVGLIYDDTITGLLNSKLTKEQFSNFEFLNAGVASYSTYIYLKKIKSVLNANKWLKVSSVVVLHDKSDLRDDLIYLKMNKPSEFEIVDMKYKNRRKYFFYEDLKNYSFWRFYRKQTIIGLLLDNIGNRIEDFFRNLRDRYKLASKNNKNFFEINKYQIRAIRSVNSMKSTKKFYYNKKKWNDEGIKSLNFTIENLLKLKNYLNTINIKLYVLLYPYSYEILEDNPRLLYLNSVIPKLEENNINYLNTYPKFFIGDIYKNIDNFYIYNDIHYNKLGNLLLTDIIFDEIYKREN